MDLHSQSDEMLVLQYQKSEDTRYLDELFGRHIGKVCGMLQNILLDHADAEDVTQEVFVKAARALPRFERRSKFSTWLYRISMNAAKSFLAKPARVREVIVADPAVAHADHRLSPDAEARYRELDQVMARAMKSLPPNLRSAVVLTLIEGLSTAEAAKIEGTTRGTMYWRVHAARRQLKADLDAYHAD